MSRNVAESLESLRIRHLKELSNLVQIIIEEEPLECESDTEEEVYAEVHNLAEALVEHSIFPTEED